MSGIQRHRAAIRRTTLSRPLRLAIEQDIVTTDMSVFDFGCGLGDDVRRLQRRGFKAQGWDPHHRPDAPLKSADAVYLGFVLNVIEVPRERGEVLARAWSLAGSVLIVGALVTADARGGAVPFGDGVVTTVGTFQKYFEQQELEALLRDALDVNPIALGLGAFAVVRDPARRAALLTKRFRVARHTPIEAMTELFSRNRNAIEPVVDFFREHGRWPRKGELVQSAFTGLALVGGLGRATTLVQRSVPNEVIDLWRRDAVDSLRVLLAALVLSRSDRLSDLDPLTQADIRAHFGRWDVAWESGEKLLFSAGEALARRRSARGARVGKRMPDAIYVHKSALGLLPPALQIYEICARRFLGDNERANMVKLRLSAPMVSYLSYPDFDRDPHPHLERSLRVDLRTFRVEVRDYADRANRPILHRKEQFVATDYPKAAMFARLTAQEERWALFDRSTGDIGTEVGWRRRLDAAGVHLRGHRICRGGE